MVTDDDSGQSIQGDERTSSGMFLDKAQVKHNNLSVLYMELLY